MLDRVHHVPDCGRGAVEPLDVRGDPDAHPVCFLHQRLKFSVGELRRVGILQLVRARAGRHHLDEVRPGPQLLTDRLAHVIGSVGLTVIAP
jgi:hypothetical protein